jgi:hypothetical protein
VVTYTDRAVAYVVRDDRFLLVNLHDDEQRPLGRLWESIEASE